ncbi:ATP-binding protein [Candidatus Babeliales bacterium]|nr:ATP-binding protein [Candidatus Babeliales bacterium]
MLKMYKKYVLTGGPRTGKTTLLNFLGKKGYKTIRESASLLIKQAVERHSDAPWRDVINFQKNIFYMQLELESKIKDGQEAFLDRGIIDGIAYSKFYKVPPFYQAIDYTKIHKYSAIFFLDFVDNYENDSIRIESFKQAKQIHFLLRKTYEDFGYKMIFVPPLNVEQRAIFVCERIKQIDIKRDYVFGKRFSRSL